MKIKATEIGLVLNRQIIDRTEIIDNQFVEVVYMTNNHVILPGAYKSNAEYVNTDGMDWINSFVLILK